MLSVPIRIPLFAIILVWLLAIPTARPAFALADDSTEDSEPRWTFDWDNSFKITRNDGEIALTLGGRIQNDWVFYDADSALEARVGELEDGSEFRRARLFVSGKLWKVVELKVQYDFAGGDATFKDVYLGLIDLPGVGGLRIGHLKEPFSLDEQTSSKYILFMERAPVLEAFSLARNNGFMIGQNATGKDPRITWRLGAFKEVDDFGDGLSEEWNLTGRITGTPVWKANSKVLHLGLAVSLRSPADDTVRFRSRPGSHLAPRFVDTGPFAADGVTQLGLELAWIDGPLSTQAEWVRADVDALGAPDPTFGGYYAAVGWILKRGYSRPYKRSEGSLDRLEVRDQDRFRRGGWGIWELAARYSSLDLDDGAVRGGQLDDWTLGLNWYLLSNVRTTFNYVRADLDGVGTADALQLRFQVEF